MPASESVKIERLVGLCKLWGAVKYFHPYLAYRQDIDWDAALVATIPKVRAAQDAGEYAAAVQGLLEALGDPVSAVTVQPAVTPQQAGSEKTAATEQPAENQPGLTGAASPAPERQPTWAFTPDGMLVVSLHADQNLPDFISVMQKMEAIKAEIPKAGGVLFDLRSAPRVSYEMGEVVQLAFRSSEIATLLSTTPFVTASQRTRMHRGFPPQFGGWGFPYTSAFQVLDGRRIFPAPGARQAPLVFLVNAWSVLPSEALALQIAGKAAILAEGSPSMASLGVKTHPIRLSEGVTAVIRLGEIISQDGSGGFLPDQVISPAQAPEMGDPALDAALALLKDFKLSKKKHKPLPPYAVPLLENNYPEMAFPPLEYRLLAAFRVWTIINYFFPYKDLTGEDWDGVLREFIPRMEQASSDVEYHLAAAEMITRIHDCHGFVYSPVLHQHWGTARAPLYLQIVENVPVVTAILDEDAAKTAGVCCGDVVLKIDGEDALERIAGRAKYRAASTPQWQLYQAAQDSLLGPEGSWITLSLLDRQQQVKEVRLPRKERTEVDGNSQRSGEVVRWLTEDIGYADLDRLEVPAVEEMFEKFKDSRAIIFDMRGFPKGTAWAIAPRLAAQNEVQAAQIQIPFVAAPDGPSGDMANQVFSNIHTQCIPPTDQWRYRGKTVLLIDERTLSQAEHTGLFFEAANGTKFVGSHSAGANGDVTAFCLPGNISGMFTGLSVRHADGRQLQRIGLVPDVEIRPTIQGLQNGIDEVLEGAIQYLQKQA